MKKASTWYLIVMAVFNLVLAQGTTESARMWTSGYREMFAPSQPHIFEATRVMLSLHWWPYLFAGFAATLALVSIRSSRPSTVFYHFIAIMLLVECSILFLSQAAFVLPLVATDYSH